MSDVWLRILAKSSNYYQEDWERGKTLDLL
jgi:hypothetical protein